MRIGDNYYLLDLEGGFRFKVTQQAHDEYLAMWNALRKNLVNSGHISVVTFYTFPWTRETLNKIDKALGYDREAEEGLLQRQGD